MAIHSGNRVAKLTVLIPRPYELPCVPFSPPAEPYSSLCDPRLDTGRTSPYCVHAFGSYGPFFEPCHCGHSERFFP